MNRGFVIGRLGALAVLGGLVLAGCSTPDVNPKTPRPKTGYVDFYTDSSLELSWEVKRASEPAGEMRSVFSEFSPVQGTILRLATPPGRHRFQVWFNNQVTEGPQTVPVEVADGQITPVHVTLAPAGSTLVQSKDFKFTPGARGYRRGNKITNEANAIFRIGLAAETPRAYQPKERMPYYAAGAQ